MSFVTPISAFLTSAIAAATAGPYVIRFCSGLGAQPIREDGPDTHLKKHGTPAMGGLMILPVAITIFLIISGINKDSLVLAATVASFGFIGLLDDLKKIKYKNSYRGLSSKLRLVMQFGFAIPASFFAYRYNDGSVWIPFISYVNIHYAYIVFAAIVIVGSANAMNLTDGLDGLASVPAAVCLSLMGYIGLTEHLVDFTSVSAIFALSFAGALIGFLWHNVHPAKIFMGDLGSMSCGAAMGLTAIFLRAEFVLMFAGLIFVVETISVAMQVFWYKRTKKRLFKMAPIHHHFEKAGVPETVIVQRFWILSFIFAIFAFLIRRLG